MAKPDFFSDDKQFPVRLAEGDIGEKGEADLFYARRLGSARPAAPSIGLALSGGGIRSATLSLGYLQALAAARALQYVDYLSTVSGGGYAGAFLGGLFQPRTQAAPNSVAKEKLTKEAKPALEQSRVQTCIDEVEKKLIDGNSDAVRWLRENGSYLAPNGAPDQWEALATVVRNLSAIAGYFAVFTITLLLVARSVRAFVESQLLANADACLLWGNVWWSPWFALPVLVLTVICIPTSTAFWLVGGASGDSPGSRWPKGIKAKLDERATPIAYVCLALLSCIGSGVLLWSYPDFNQPQAWVAVILGSLALFTLIVWAFVTRLGRATGSNARNLVTLWLRTGLVVLVASLAFAVLDTLGQTFYAWAISGERTWPIVGSASVTLSLGAAAAFVQKILGALGTLRTRLSLGQGAMAALAALLVVGAILVTYSTVAHAIAWAGASPLNVHCLPFEQGCPATTEHGLVFSLASDVRVDPTILYWCTAGGVVLTALLGCVSSFLNRSSLASFYAARLTRAYLGASNPDRKLAVNKNVTRLLDKDVIPFEEYAPHEHGGPLHIINVTLNETVSGQSQIEQPTSYGMNMAVGPAGVSVGVKHHALWKYEAGKRTHKLKPWDRKDSGESVEGFQIFCTANDANVTEFDATPMHLGQWIGVSGAAVSPGLGWRTSLGLSLLTGLFNLRLGRWWFSGVDPLRRERHGISEDARDNTVSDHQSVLHKFGRFFSRWSPVYAHLLDELLARFHGPASRYWYLTDGGHFENTAAYELIRRRVAFIVVCDNGGDGTEDLADFGDLVRKARLDFGAEISFLDDTQLEGIAKSVPEFQRIARHVGSLARLGFCEANANESKDCGPTCAALARVDYGDPKRPGLLLLLRPRVMIDHSVDVRQYQRANKDFPNQSTLDQFFDERQWESYRRLGYEIGASLFPAGAEEFWPHQVIEWIRK